jgi:hypothetical protein
MVGIPATATGEEIMGRSAVPFGTQIPNFARSAISKRHAEILIGESYRSLRFNGFIQGSRGTPGDSRP